MRNRIKRGRDGDDEKIFARELTRICTKRELRLFVVSASLLQHPALFFIKNELG